MARGKDAVLYHGHRTPGHVWMMGGRGALVEAAQLDYKTRDDTTGRDGTRYDEIGRDRDGVVRIGQDRTGQDRI
jgi:hypothetical protein